MDIKIKSDEAGTCYCYRIPQINHDLSQTLLIMHAYVKGCSERLKENNLDSIQLSTTLEKINKQIEFMSHKIHSMI